LLSLSQIEKIREERTPIMSDSLNDSFTIQELINKSPRQSSVSISFSSHECPLNYSTDIDEAEHIDIPISPVSPDNVEQAQAETVATATELLVEEESIYNVEQAGDTAAIKTEEEEESEISIPSNLPNELSISTSQTLFSHCNRKNKNGESPLSLSSSECFLKGMKLLIDRGANINVQDKYGRTPLHLACENVDSERHHECIEYLLQHGANPSIQDDFGRTPLHTAVEKGCLECVRLLMQVGNANPNLPDAHGDLALHIAARKMDLDLMEALSPAACTSSSDSDNDSGSQQFSPNIVPSRTLIQESAYNDSGYFTARGAWTKNKYYPSDKTEEKEDTCISENVAQSETDSDDESPTNASLNKRQRTSQCLDLILRLVICAIDSLLAWLANHHATSKTTQHKMGVEATTTTTTTTTTLLKEPPAHIKEAMERYKREQEMQ
jgi:ankyrin repeat protein